MIDVLLIPFMNFSVFLGMVSGEIPRLTLLDFFRRLFVFALGATMCRDFCLSLPAL